MAALVWNVELYILLQDYMTFRRELLPTFSRLKREPCEQAYSNVP
jgi:hypothetical protein